MKLSEINFSDIKIGQVVRLDHSKKLAWVCGLIAERKPTPGVLVAGGMHYNYGPRYNEIMLQHESMNVSSIFHINTGNCEVLPHILSNPFECPNIFEKIKVQEYFERVEALLADPDRWCKGYHSRKANGDLAVLYTSEAHSWCIWGAFSQAAHGSDMKFDTYTPIFNTMFQLAQEKGHKSLAAFNDHPDTKHGDILEFISEVRGKLQ